MAKLSELEICVEDQTLYFTASPYYLKFDLPGPVVTEDEAVETIFDGGDLVVRLQKPEPQYYKDINLITKLLCCTAQSNAHKTKQLIEDISPTIKTEPRREEVVLDWLCGSDFSVSVRTDALDDNPVLIPPCYGFAGSKSGLFSVESDLLHVVDLPNPDDVSIRHRWQLRLSEEQRKFSPTHYLADYYEPDIWHHIRHSKPEWKQTMDSPELTDSERHRLITLSNRRLPLLSCSDPAESMSLYLGLADLLMAYAYDYRVRDGDELTESGWNICKLAATLSWFEVFTNVPHLLITFYRRALVYPLFRNWKICSIIRSDVVALLKRSDAKLWCLKCLLEIRRLLIAYPGYHVFADLYLDDYIVWIQTGADKHHLTSLGEALRKFDLTEDMLDLDLTRVKQVGAQVLEDEALSGHMESLGLQNSS